jgi:hypothetical protein
MGIAVDRPMRRDAMPLAELARVPHVMAMMSTGQSTTYDAGRPRKAASAHGPIIDQDGFEVRPEQLRPDVQGFRFDFGAGANPFANLTREQRLARLDALAKLLDVAFIVPGTKIRYGIDGLIGLIPIVGDIITTAISLWVVREARALGAPWHLTARMLGNVAVDGAVGIVPFIGDAFDVMFRANVRNVRMLRKWLEKQPRL